MAFPVSELRHHRKILVIEDEQDTRMLLADHFDRLGYQVETAGDGNEGITRALRLRPDAIVLDLEMPRLDGWDTVRLLRAYPTTAAIPVIAYTGTLEVGEARALAGGCSAVIRKPFPPEDLERVINALLEEDEPDESGAG